LNRWRVRVGGLECSRPVPPAVFAQSVSRPPSLHAVSPLIGGLFQRFWRRGLLLLEHRFRPTGVPPPSNLDQLQDRRRRGDPRRPEDCLGARGYSSLLPYENEVVCPPVTDQSRMPSSA